MPAQHRAQAAEQQGLGGEGITGELLLAVDTTQPGEQGGVPHSRFREPDIRDATCSRASSPTIAVSK